MGKFVISLDFELYWGMRDKRKLDDYKENLLGVRTVIPQLLNLFEKYNINATFATVGFLFYENKEKLLLALPTVKPNYLNTNLSPYQNHFEQVGFSEEEDPFHFASTLIKTIQLHSRHEIASHSFSHYYCLEKGQSKEAFRADLKATKRASNLLDVDLKSFVFPRNQYDIASLDICKEEGFTSFRGNESSWLYHSKSGEEETLFRRFFRLLDAYVNISGHHCYDCKSLKTKPLMNIPSSRFLRAYTPKLSFLYPLHLRRIKNGMSYAAKNNLLYHLWWHPHNFGKNRKENLAGLEEILLHYQSLSNDFDFESATMEEVFEAFKLQT